MKKEDVPQDLSTFSEVTREVCYATDADGKYTTILSKGWDVKTIALGVVWEDIKLKVAEARQSVLDNKASPILFFMEYSIMDIEIVSSYTGFWKWQIKRHLRPPNFNKLSNKKLQRYADAFGVTIDDLKKMNVHED